MDDHEMDDLAEDADIARMLRGRADELTGPVDLDAAFADVRARARVRRGGRIAARTIAAAAAAAVIVFGFVALGRPDREVVGPADPIGTAAPITTTPVAPTAPSATPPTGPSTSTSTIPTTTAVAPTTASAAVEPTTFESRGGSITVRVVEGRVALDGEPAPSSGWTASVHDDGPTRVRVRFERGDERVEIRVDLQDGQLVDRITDE